MACRGQSDGYRDGSPINFATSCREPALVHGTGDDNCHYQGVEALINELVRHNKPFSLMAYPNRTTALAKARTPRGTCTDPDALPDQPQRPGPLPAEAWSAGSLMFLPSRTVRAGAGSRTGDCWPTTARSVWTAPVHRRFS